LADNIVDDHEPLKFMFPDEDNIMVKEKVIYVMIFKSSNLIGLSMFLVMA
jgi:hypothetical protein